MKHMLTTTALGLILATAPAMAQDQKPADSPPAMTQDQKPADSPPAMQNQAPAGGTTTAPKEMDSQADAEKPGMKSSSGNLDYVDTQEQGQWLASDLIGETVYNSEDEKVGDINNLLVDENGSIAAAVIGVGGFLGIGEKDIAVAFDALEVGKDQNNATKVSLDTNKESLESAPEFVSWQDRQDAANSNANKMAPQQPTTPPANQ